MAGPVPGMPYIQSAKQNMTKMSCADLRARRDPAIQAMQAACALVLHHQYNLHHLSLVLACGHVINTVSTNDSTERCSQVCQRMTHLSDARK